MLKLFHPWVTFEAKELEGIYYPRTAIELTALRFVQEIIDKPNWRSKWENATIRQKWLQEISSELLKTKKQKISALREKALTFRNSQTELTKSQKSIVNFVVKELNWRSKQPPSLTETTVPGVFVKVISKKQKEKIIGIFDQVVKDQSSTSCVGWHPPSKKTETAENENTKTQTLDVIHPSWYCRPLKIKKPKIKKLTKFEKELQNYTQQLTLELYEAKTYVWVPTNVKVDQKGDSKFQGFINNLHPFHHARLYPILEEFFSFSLGAFQKVIDKIRDEPTFKDPRWKRTSFDAWYRERQQKIQDYNDALQEKREKGVKEEEGRKSQPKSWFDLENQPLLPWRPPNELGVDLGSNSSSSSSSKSALSPSALFKSSRSKPYFSASSKRNGTDDTKEFNLNGRTLQVFVKMVSLELTPESPHFSEGSWHVEGTKNENIVATCIYYFSSSNVTDSYLEFRVPIEEPDYAQDDKEGVSSLYDLKDEQVLFQTLGRVQTPVKRMICFPNTLQHRVANFSLKNPKLAGHRRFLLFWLVHPTEPILSTNDFVFRQKSWFMDSFPQMLESLKLFSSPFKNPTKKDEQQSITQDQARKEVVELMKERKFLQDKRQVATEEERQFSLCEH